MLHFLPHLACCSLPSVSIGSDPLLSVIASSLASRRAGQGQGSAHEDGLPAHMAEWLVLWDQITLDRPIGKGSFGWGEYYLPRLPFAGICHACSMKGSGSCTHCRGGWQLCCIGGWS